MVTGKVQSWGQTATEAFPFIRVTFSQKTTTFFGDTQQLLFKEDLYFEEFPVPQKNHRWAIRNYKLKTQV